TGIIGVRSELVNMRHARAVGRTTCAVMTDGRDQAPCVRAPAQPVLWGMLEGGRRGPFDSLGACRSEHGPAGQSSERIWNFRFRAPASPAQSRLRGRFGRGGAPLRVV